MKPECQRLWDMLLDGLNYRQMSADLDVAEGTLRVRVLRCRQQATKLWNDMSDPRRAIAEAPGGRR